MKRFMNSLRYAIEGLSFAFHTQANMKIHVVVALSVIVLGVALQITKWEILVVLIAIVFVIFAELMNTAVETVVDLMTEGKQHELAKTAKDVAAGAVLVAAVFAVIAGFAVFLGPLWEVISCWLT